MAYVVTRGAEEQLIAIEAHGIREWGRAASDRYQDLLFLVFAELGNDPFQLHHRVIRKKNPCILAYHIKDSRDHLPMGNRVKDPRHLVIYGVDQGMTEIYGFVHDTAPVRRAALRLAKRVLA